MASVAHLAVRFLGSIKPGPPAPVDEAWAQSVLSPGELAIWRRMSNPDRRHAIEVARSVVAELGEEIASTPVTVAALMHDSGKVICGYRTPMRVVATVVWSLVDHGVASQWLERARPLRRLAEYRLHPELGADLLADVGSHESVIYWTADHHRPAEQWRIDPVIGAVLKSCDGD